MALRLRNEYSLFDSEFVDDVKNMGGTILWAKGEFAYDKKEHSINFGYCDYEKFDCIVIVDNMIFYFKEYIKDRDVHDEVDAIMLVSVERMSDRLIYTLKTK